MPSRANPSSPNHPDRSSGSTWLTVAAATVPPALAGGLLGLLLLYLNSDLARPAAEAARVMGGYALLGLAAGATLVLPFLWRNLARATAFFPWSVTVVLAAGAAYYIQHASRWSFYLPATVNRQLVFVGAICFLVGLIAFYTALLHTIHQREYSFRSVGLVAACGAASLLAGIVLRAPQPADPDPPSAVRLAREPVAPLVVIGLEGATLEVLLPLVEQGALPLLGSWIDQGALAPVATLRPPRGEALWATLATGTWPFQHQLQGPRIYSQPWGVTGSIRLLPEWIRFDRWGLAGVGSRPVSGSDLRRKPLWRIYEDLALASTVVGWPTTAAPVSVEDLPTLTAAEDLTLVRLADLAVASEAGFGAWARVRDGDRDPELVAKADRLEAAFRATDSALAAWQTTLPADSVVAVVAPFGYGPLSAWRRTVATVAGGDAFGGTARGGRAGVLLLRGPGIRPGARLPPVRLVDIMPTLMHAAGLPVAADLAGEVVTRAFAPEGLVDRPLTFVPSYESWTVPPVSPVEGPR